jgi:hypothetical protein
MGPLMPSRDWVSLLFNRFEVIYFQKDGGRGGFEYTDKLYRMNTMLKFGFESIP